MSELPDLPTDPVALRALLASLCDERDRALAELADSRARLDLALRYAGGGLWDWRLSTNEIEVDAHWYALFGDAEDEIGRRPEAWLPLIHPVDLGAAQALLRGHLRGDL